MSEYLGEEAVGAHEASFEALGKMFENVELQSKEISAAMQEFDSRIFAHRFYHEAPNYVFELFVRLLSDGDKVGWGKGGLNVLRLVSKRCLQVVESVATRLTGKGAVNSISAAVKRCERIEQIRCNSSLRSLEGCPDGLKIKDLSPLSQCPDLEELNISWLDLIKDISFFDKGFTKLKCLNLTGLSADDLSPLIKLQSLEDLRLYYEKLPPTTSLLPLARCTKLKFVEGLRGQGMDLAELKYKRPDLDFSAW